ncbi:DUF3139 domain-containing protein [Psychrobacillus sp. PGGUH221]|uniref:DUF3139 domain-containing protein n=1 Tax=Psychrobacillus sp. PGGUH221 TaxID=3020058 RepID=UPI0035C73E22
MFKNGNILSKKVLILIIFLVVIFGTFFVANLKIENNKKMYEKRVTCFLLEEKGYDRTEIKSVEGFYGFKLPKYYAVVVFEDESYVKYIYYAHDGVIQIKYILTDEAIKMNIDKSELKHYNPINEIDKYIIE